MRDRFTWKRFFESALALGAARLLGRAARIQVPKRVLRRCVETYVACWGVDMSEALVPEGGFGSFGEFFARRLMPGARPVCGVPGAVVSPCDGALLDSGRIGDDDAATSLEVKGVRYGVPELVGDAKVASGLAGGGWCLLYLHPRDYHRVHAPLDATLREVRHLPGARYPMAPWASKLGGGALAKNERVAFDLELPGVGRRCVLLMVAAFGVGGVECLHLPEGGQQVRSINCALSRGEDLAAFRLGSTVVLLWPRGTLELESSVRAGSRVLAGQRLGMLLPADGPDR